MGRGDRGGLVEDRPAQVERTSGIAERRWRPRGII
jgi:hypothetical protein